MDKEKFCKILRNVENAWNLDNGISETITEFGYKKGLDVEFEGFGTVLASDVIDLLAEIIGDTTGEIEYFCWELRFGKDWKPGTIILKDGTDVDYSSPEKLYDFLMSEENTQ